MTPLSAARFRMFAVLLTRFGLASTFLSGVADRFGAWGRHGAPNVSWGDMHHFAARAQAIFPQASPALALFAAWVATVLDTAFGLGLLIGVRTRTMAFGSGSCSSRTRSPPHFRPARTPRSPWTASAWRARPMLLAAVSDDL
jgi:hypothetical protein